MLPLILYKDKYYFQNCTDIENSSLLTKCNDTCPMILGCSEDDPEETFPASRVISSQILGYNGGKVDTEEMVEVIFPVNVSMCFHAWRLHLTDRPNSCMHQSNAVTTFVDLEGNWLCSSMLH